MRKRFSLRTGSAAPALMLASSLALLPGLCGEKQDPSQGVPPKVWALRQAMEREVTRDGTRETVSPEQALRVREAADAVARWEAIGDPDVAAEVLYLLPRTWHWEQQEAIRDLLVLLQAGKAGQVLQAEATWADAKKATEFRKQAMLAQMRWQKVLAPLGPAERVARVLADLGGGVYEEAKFGWSIPLNLRYAQLALESAPAEAVAPLAALAAERGPRREFALRTLARIGSPDAVAALRLLYGDGVSDAGSTGVLQAAIRFHALVAVPDPAATVIVHAPDAPALDAGTAQTIVVDAAGWEARTTLGADPRVYVRVGVEDAAYRRAALLPEGERATCVVEDLRPGGAVRVALRLRRVEGMWFVAAWEEIR